MKTDKVHHGISQLCTRSDKLIQMWICFWFSDCFDAVILFVFSDNRRIYLALCKPPTHAASVICMCGILKACGNSLGWQTQGLLSLPWIAMFVPWRVQKVHERAEVVCGGYQCFSVKCKFMFQLHLMLILKGVLFLKLWALLTLKINSLKTVFLHFHEFIVSFPNLKWLFDIFLWWKSHF